MKYSQPDKTFESFANSCLYLTVEERYAIYKKVFMYYHAQSQCNWDNDYGVCQLLKQFFGMHFNAISSIRNPIFPEFYRCKPIRLNPAFYNYWWDVTDVQIRIKVLDFIMSDMRRKFPFLILPTKQKHLIHRRILRTFKRCNYLLRKDEILRYINYQINKTK